MQAEQPQPEDFLLVDEVADVRPAEPGASRARASVVEGTVVASEAGVAEVEAALARESAPGACGAGRQDAVEHFDAPGVNLDPAPRVAVPHEERGLLLWTAAIG